MANEAHKEPTMEEILASIRKIIADDGPAAPPAGRPVMREVAREPEPSRPHFAYDPTGAGDCFAGGMMGHLAAAHSKDLNVSLDSIRTALAHGTVSASFNIESFSLNRVAALKAQEIAQRFEEFQELVKF